MENKKSKVPVVCVGIIIALLIAVIVLLVVLINKEDKEQNFNTENIQNITGNVTQEDTVKTDEELIEEEFLDHFKKLNETAEEKFLDCKVNLVTIVTGTEKQEILDMDQGQYYKESDILFIVEYSIKPQNTDNSIWDAGKGADAVDGWFNLRLTGYMRDGKIVDMGTGW